jgi:hypothetical protein
VRDEVIPHIFHLDSPNEVWNELKEFYKDHKATSSKEQVLQDEHARNIKHGIFLVHCQGPFGSNHRGQ